jgi:outer membrane protein
MDWSRTRGTQEQYPLYRYGVDVMRTLGLALAGLLLVGSTSVVEAQQAFRVGYIDSQAILMEAPGAREAQEEFERQLDRMGLEVQQMEDELDNLIAEYERQQATLLANVREARENEIMQRNQRFQQRIEEMDYELAMSRQALLEPIIDEMTRIIEDVRSEGGYAVIFDVQGQSIVAADPTLDLTDEVLRRLGATPAGSAEP